MHWLARGGQLEMGLLGLLSQNQLGQGWEETQLVSRAQHWLWAAHPARRALRTRAAELRAAGGCRAL